MAGKAQDVFNNINNGCNPLQGGPGIVRTGSLALLTGTLKGTEPSVMLFIPHVLFLL